MQVRKPLTLSASALTWLRRLLCVGQSTAPSISSLSSPRKLKPIDDVLAQVGRDPIPPA